MSEFTVAFVGTGPDPDNPVWGKSAAMAWRHAGGYAAREDCDVVACADLVREHAEAFAEEWGIDAEHVYEDYEVMLAEAEPDVVSVCTPVPTHAPIVIDLCESGVVQAVHCEKPMATTWGDSRAMAAAADEAGVQLTFNHQRRFDERWVRARELLDDGVIGDLRRVEVGGKNLYDYGSHMLDLANAFAGEADVSWVIGQIDYREADVRYGAHNENQGLVSWEWASGVRGLASTGRDTGEPLIGAEHRVLGTEGEIEVNPTDGPDLRYRVDGEGWQAVDVDADANPIHAAIDHLIECLDAGSDPEIGADNALRVTEMIFAAWESARRRGRVDLPLDVEDNPLTDLVERGEIEPVGLEDGQ